MLVYGCGDKNSISNADQDERAGGVAFTFKSSKEKVSPGYPEPTNVRVFIRRYEADYLRFKAIVDVEVPTDTTIIMTVPASDFRYQIDAISYLDSSAYSFKPIYKYDQVTGVTVVPDSITQVTLTLEPVLPFIMIPDTVILDKFFNIDASLGLFRRPTNKNFIQGSVYLKHEARYINSFTNEGADQYGPYGTTTQCYWGLTLSDYANKFEYFQIIVHLSGEDFYFDDESNDSFVWNYPNPYVADTIKTFVKAPDGGIGVEVLY